MYSYRYNLQICNVLYGSVNMSLIIKFCYFYTFMRDNSIIVFYWRSKERHQRHMLGTNLMCKVKESETQCTQYPAVKSKEKNIQNSVAMVPIPIFLCAR